jgi:hypothetical protein
VTSFQGLRQRIRDSYEARWKAEKHFDEEEIMQELPNSLRTEARLRPFHSSHRSKQNY